MDEFPELPEDLSSLSDEDLARLIDEFRASVNEALGAATTAEELDRIESDGVQRLRSLEGEQERRTAESAEVEQRRAELLAALNSDQPSEEEEPAEATEDQPEQTPEPEQSEDQPQSVAAAGPRRRPAAAPARRGSLGDARRHRSPAHDPQAAQAGPQLRILAAPDLGRFSTGQELTFAQIGEAMHDRYERLRKSSGGDGDVVPIATVEVAAPEDRTLRSNLSAIENRDRVSPVLEAVRGTHDALTAAGGLCAPATPYYDLLRISDASRPVRDALPSFGADRGAITLMAPATLGDLTGSVTVVTAAQDQAGGVGSTKDCLHVTCPPARTYQVDAISRCVEFGNFGARTFPELVEHWTELSTAAWARRAETVFLDAIAANSIAVTAPSATGVGREIVARAAQAAAGYRSRHRMDPDAVLDALMPSWAIAAATADWARGGDDPGTDVRRQTVEGWLRDVGVRVNWYLDGKTGGAQVFGAQASGGVMLTFPATMIWYLFVPGTFLALDNGVLDFGLVRDSTLNTRNDFRIHVESFERVAYLGFESLEISQGICANGAKAPAAAALTCPV